MVIPGYIGTIYWCSVCKCNIIRIFLELHQCTVHQDHEVNYFAVDW